MLDFGFYNQDCLEAMKEFPDNYFSLAIVDPPYGGALRKQAVVKVGLASTIKQIRIIQSITTDSAVGLINTKMQRRKRKR